MFIFSCNATAKANTLDIKEGQVVPFMVYINYADLFGAEQLCQMYLMKAGFTKIELEKRRFVQQKTVEKIMYADTDVQEAIKNGYQIRMFDAS